MLGFTSGMLPHTTGPTPTLICARGRDSKVLKEPSGHQWVIYRVFNYGPMKTMLLVNCCLPFTPDPRADTWQWMLPDGTVSGDRHLTGLYLWPKSSTYPLSCGLTCAWRMRSFSLECAILWVWIRPCLWRREGFVPSKFPCQVQGLWWGWGKQPKSLGNTNGLKRNPKPKSTFLIGASPLLSRSARHPLPNSHHPRD